MAPMHVIPEKLRNSYLKINTGAGEKKNDFPIPWQIFI